jgi:ribosome biogenesis GTPase
VSGQWDHLTDDDVRVRPPRRGSRPRTKTRPAHAGAVAGFVDAVDRGRYRVHVAGREVMAIKARELGHRGVVVGDEAHLVGDLSGDDDALARIVRVSPRRTELRRATEEGRGRERVIVANADRMVIVASAGAPAPNPRLIDRQLVAAYEAGLDAVICLTKADLGGGGGLVELYEALGVRVVLTGRGGLAGAGGKPPLVGLAGVAEVAEAAGGGKPPLVGLDGVAALLTGRVSVLVGHSGVGKSTLINALIPGAVRATGHVNAVTGKGRHTSSSAVALPLASGGWVIDTPGVRSFGLAHVPPDAVLEAFPDLAAVAANCPRGCAHSSASADCALETWAACEAEGGGGSGVTGGADGTAGAGAEGGVIRAARAARLESYRRIVAGLAD